MELSITNQLTEAAAALGMGIAAGFFYDILRAIRRRAEKTVITMLMDVLFWLVCGGALIVFSLTIGKGEQRLFVLVLTFSGGWLYFVTISPWALWLCESILELIRFSFLCISAPFVLIFRSVKKLINFVKNIFSYEKKWCTIKNYKSLLGSLSLGEVFENEAEKGRSYNQDRSGSADSIRSRKARKYTRSNRRRKGRSR